MGGLRVRKMCCYTLNWCNLTFLPAFECKYMCWCFLSGSIHRHDRHVSITWSARGVQRRREVPAGRGVRDPAQSNLHWGQAWDHFRGQPWWPDMDGEKDMGKDAMQQSNLFLLWVITQAAIVSMKYSLNGKVKVYPQWTVFLSCCRRWTPCIKQEMWTPPHP